MGKSSIAGTLSLVLRVSLYWSLGPLLLHTLVQRDFSGLLGSGAARDSSRLRMDLKNAFAAKSNIVLQMGMSACRCPYVAPAIVIILILAAIS